MAMKDAAVDIAAGRPKWATFFHQWMMHPRSMASVAPSGRQLALLMAAALPSGARRVIELGAGTGAITQALLDRGIEPGDLLSLELNPALYEVLRKHFPNVRVICGDARRLRAVVEGSTGFRVGDVDAVCSSLGLLTMPKDVQRDILAAAFDVLKPGGAFIQYTYGPLGHPVDDFIGTRMRLRHRAAGTAWRNLPPAKVFVYWRM